MQAGGKARTLLSTEADTGADGLRQGRPAGLSTSEATMSPAPAHGPDALHSPMQRICGWCRAELTPGTQPATYVICACCHLQLEREAIRLPGKQAREAAAALSRRVRHTRHDLA